MDNVLVGTRAPSSSTIAIAGLVALLAVDAAPRTPSWHLAALIALAATTALPFLVAPLPWQRRTLVALGAALAPAAQVALHRFEELWHAQSTSFDVDSGLVVHLAVLVANAGVSLGAVLVASAATLLALILMTVAHEIAWVLAALTRLAPPPATHLSQPRDAVAAFAPPTWIAYAIRRGPPSAATG